MGAEIDFLDFGGDCHIARIPENAFKLAAEIRHFQPAIVLAPHPGENQHPDHAVTGHLMRDACRFARYAGLDALKKFSLEGTAAHTIGALYLHHHARNSARPISSSISATSPRIGEAAMLLHASQMRSRNYADLRMSAARHLGLSIGVEYAAGFYANDPVRVGSLSELTLSSRHF